MRRSPRLRRLESDWKAMQLLQAESSIVHITTPATPFAGPPEVYFVRFRGPGVWKPEGSDRVLLREGHEVLIRLGASYPRMIPELAWRTPVFHPNISANGVVCLGGYSTHWAPGLRLDELCVMLWDMARYANYDVNSPYNRAAAQWACSQTEFRFPIDGRVLRDRLARPAGTSADGPVMPVPPSAVVREPASAGWAWLDDDIVEAELVTEGGWKTASPDVLYIG
ncbi:MAG: ubiquitin-conjugating enzyme E2 [Candidatus Anammoximicrobium sp.]|nr:ubiquitin-conjugating enzyme E2 [Candidatus Anammoximicrobium sp.]